MSPRLRFAVHPNSCSARLGSAKIVSISPARRGMICATECAAQHEPGSEGNFLKPSMLIMKKTSSWLFLVLSACKFESVGVNVFVVVGLLK